MYDFLSGFAFFFFFDIFLNKFLILEEGKPSSK